MITLEDGTREGFIIDLLNELDLDYTIVSPEDKRYGLLDVTTGKWTGMIGMLQDNVSIFFHLKRDVDTVRKKFSFRRLTSLLLI